MKWFRFFFFVLFSGNLFSYDVLSKVSNLVINLKYQEAIVELENAISKEPNNINYYIYLVNLCLNMDEVELAEKNLKKALNFEKDNVVLNSYLMEIYRLRGKINESKVIAEKLLNIPESKTNIVFIVMYSRFLSAFNVIEAEKFLNLYIKSFKDYNLFLEIARVYMLLKDYRKVKEFLDKALVLERFDKRLYSLYGEYYFYIGDYDNAVKNLEKAILFPGKKDREYYLLSELYFRKRDYDKVLSFIPKVKFRDEVVAKVFFEAGKYLDLVKNFKDSENEVVRYYLEESSIKLSPNSISDLRKDLSEYRLLKADDIKKKFLPYYDLYLRRSIKLNPLNYKAWFNLAQYYRYYVSYYFSFDELKPAENLFVNDIEIQDYFNSIKSYVLNTSKLSSWNVVTKRQKDVKFLIEIKDKLLPIEWSFCKDSIFWAVGSFKMINSSFVTVLGEKDLFYYRNFDVVVKLDLDIVKDYVSISAVVLDPLSLSTLTNFNISQKLGNNFLSEIYENFRIKMYSVLPSFGIVEGISGNLVVARFSNKFPKVGDEIVITSSKISDVLKGSYKEVARGKVIDTDGEYVAIDLDEKYKFISSIDRGYIVLKL